MIAKQPDDNWHPYMVVWRNVLGNMHQSGFPNLEQAVACAEHLEKLGNHVYVTKLVYVTNDATNEDK